MNNRRKFLAAGTTLAALAALPKQAKADPRGYSLYITGMAWNRQLAAPMNDWLLKGRCSMVQQLMALQQGHKSRRFGRLLLYLPSLPRACSLFQGKLSAADKKKVDAKADKILKK